MTDTSLERFSSSPVTHVSTNKWVVTEYGLQHVVFAKPADTAEEVLAAFVESRAEPSPAEIEAALVQDRVAAIKAECTTGIKAILDANTVSNLQGALLIGALDANNAATFAAGHAWVQSMIAESRRAISDGDKAAWPVPSDAIVALAALY